MKWFLIALLLCFVCGLGFGAYKLYPLYRLYQLKDATATRLKPGQEKAVFLPTGSKRKDVVELLDKEGILRSREDFVFFAKAKRYEKRRVVPGKYLLLGEMSYNKLVNHLRFGRGRKSVKVSFHYIKDLKDLAQKVAQPLEGSPEDFLKYFRSEKFLSKYGLTLKQLPAFFLTDTYRMSWSCSPRCFARRMAKVYKRFWSAKRDRQARAIGISRFQVVILASIVQAEQSKKPDEWPKIAGLYINRLKKGIKLEADPTVKFALGEPGLRRVLLKHLKVKSPYNTYLNKGLPPGPINWPEKRAILAVLNHAKHKYIYMCAKPGFSGYHNFAVTRRQHLRNAKKYHRWLNKQGIR